MNPSGSLFNMHIDQGERHRLLRASSLIFWLELFGKRMGDKKKLKKGGVVFYFLRDVEKRVDSFLLEGECQFATAK